MDEYQEYCWNRDTHPRVEQVRWSFSLATLLRVITLAGMALGWVLLLPVVRPDVLQMLVIAAGCALGTVVGYRRAGAVSRRIRAGCGFLVNAFLISIYTGYTAHVIQNPVDTRHHWRALDGLFSVLPIVAGAPIVLIILVFMLRAWIWSANDRLIDRRVTHAR